MQLPAPCGGGTWTKCEGQLVRNGGCLRWIIGVLNRTLSHMWGQLELANVPIEGWIIDPDVLGLLDGPCDDVHLNTHYGEVVHTNPVTCDVAMVIDE